MPDNRELVKKCLGTLGISPQREEEIYRELGEHISDHTEELGASGLARYEAAREALESVHDWPQLREQILAAETSEGNMNYRTKVLWLPAMVALALSNVLLAAVEIFGPPPHFYILHPDKGLEIFCAFLAPWLLTQPVVGAVAAWWSRRAGGVVRHQLLAALAPAIALFMVFLLVLPWAMIVDRKVTHSIQMTGFLVLTVTWVLVPSLPLLLGAVPFLRRRQSQG